MTSRNADTDTQQSDYLAQIEREFNTRLDAIIADLCRPKTSRHSPQDMADLEFDYERRKRDQASSGWIGDPRGPRRSKTFTMIVGYWSERQEFGDVNYSRPECFRCRMAVTNWQQLDRAHLVDRARNGLDLESNLIPLCRRCHAIMPSFGPEEGLDAIAWASR